MELRHVLFVEDQDDLRDLMQDALADMGYDVTLARNGVEALDLLEGGQAFSHVVTDVSMPEGVSGLDVAMEAMRRQPDARVIVASGFQRSQLPPIPEGVAFLPKPYRLKQLLSVLEAPDAGQAPPQG